ncbi:LLM class F420-dependent oxidoreductase [Oerskovia sp. M15]
MTRPVRIGVQLQPQHADYQQIRDAVARAEDAGVDVIFNWDHFFPLSGDPDGKHFECWTMLGAWAEQTSRVQIGALVTCNSYRNPELLADMARTVDHISGGRLILGIGAAGSRRTTTSSATSSAPRARASPTSPRRSPDQGPLGRVQPDPTREIPILIGGGGEQKTLRIVAEHATAWHSFGDAETLARKSTILDKHGATVGRDTASLVERSVAVSRPPAEVGDELVDLGATLLTVGVSGPDYDLSLVEQWVAWRDARAEG